MSSTSFKSSPSRQGRGNNLGRSAKIVSIGDFRKMVWSYYRKSGRHDLPWRKTRSPYRILVSEIMLQQTRVERVVPFYKDFLQKFPTTGRLAAASLSEVLKAWQGLGYNRRAKMLHQAAKEIVARHAGRVPRDVAALEALPGIGPYTARAIVAFAWNADVVCVETNIRTAILHHFFRGNTSIYGSISDREIEKILTHILPNGRAREWCSALMDYGAQLKHSGVRLNARGAGYAKQKAFKGSAREARGALLRTLAYGPHTQRRLVGVLGAKRKGQLVLQLARLMTEGFIKHYGNQYRLAD